MSLPRESCDYLEDMLTNVQDIVTYLNARSLDDLIQNSQLRKAVLLSFQIIGEAAGKVSEEIKARYPEIPWQKIKNFRNYLAHSYFNIDSRLVWALYEEELETLLRQLTHVMTVECT